MIRNLVNIDDIGPAPWHRCDWQGCFLSFDNTPTQDFDKNDVAEVVCYASTEESDCDGKSVVILKLQDGRFAAWETWWGPTGNGFSRDAYGGDTDIVFAGSLQKALETLSSEARCMVMNQLQNRM